MDYGRIGAEEQGRWKWPLALMKIGDTFWVHRDDRHPQLVKKLVYDRGLALSRQFVVETTSEGVRVTRSSHDRLQERKISPIGRITYGKLKELVQDCYQFNVDEIAWETVKKDDLHLVQTPDQRLEPDHNYFLVEVAGKPFKVILHPGHLYVFKIDSFEAEEESQARMLELKG